MARVGEVLPPPARRPGARQREQRKRRATMNIPRIRMGLEFVDDSGDEVCVSRIDESNGIVTLDMLDTWSRCRFGLLIRHQKRKVGSGIERYLYDRPEADHGDGAGRRLYRYHRQSIATAAGRAS